MQYNRGTTPVNKMQLHVAELMNLVDISINRHSSSCSCQTRQQHNNNGIDLVDLFGLNKHTRRHDTHNGECKATVVPVKSCVTSYS